MVGQGKVDEALRCLNERYNRPPISKTIKSECYIAWTELNQSVLLERLGRHSEVVSACDRLARQFGNRTDELSPILVIGALTVKATVLMKLDHPQDALETCDLALGRIRSHSMET